MPPPGYEPFLAAICENPDDDTVRLVYADWLDEHGDPERAEFIRCEIECETTPVTKNPSYRRAKALKKANSDKWRAELTKPPHVDWGAFRRGFVAGVQLRGSWLLHDALQAAVRVTPVQEVTILDCDPHAIMELVRAPALAQIRRLESRSGYVSDSSLVALAGCPAASGLEVLTLPGRFAYSIGQHMPVLTDRGALALARSPHLTRLRKLTFASTHLTPPAISQLRERYGDGFMCEQVLQGLPPGSHLRRATRREPPARFPPSR